jgi:hypothetical protein
MVKYIENYSPIRHYMKAKPCWHGMNIGVCKFVDKMKVYYGASHEDVKHAIGYKIVIGLMDGYKNKNHIVTCHDFFFSRTLFWNLLKVWVHATRTYKTSNHKEWFNTLSIDPKKGPKGQLWYDMHASSKFVVIS